MYKQILVAVDLTQESSWRKSLPTAVGLAKAFGAKLSIISVVPEFGMTAVGAYFPRDFLATCEADTKTKLRALTKEAIPADLPVDHIVAVGTIYKEVISAARKVGADLIILASHRPELSDYLLGPNAARVVRHANCSVMVVRD